MAQALTYEGLDHIIGLFPRNDSTPFPAVSSLYMLFFTSQTTSTVPDQFNRLTGAAGAPYTDTAYAAGGQPTNSTPALMVEETATGGYARQTLGTLNSTFPATGGSVNISGTAVRGRATQMVAPGISFAQSSAAYAQPINGFGLCNAAASTGQTTPNTAGCQKAFGYANFADGTAITVNAAGFTIRVQATFEVDG